MRITGTILIAMAAACGGGRDYLEMEPADAADALAEEGCGQAFRCGVIDIDCNTSPPTARYEPATEHWASAAVCEVETADLYVQLFVGCELADLTDRQRDDLNDCLNSVDSGCLSDAELIDMAGSVCNGQSYGSDACLRAQNVLERCFDCGNDPTSC